MSSIFTSKSYVRWLDQMLQGPEKRQRKPRGSISSYAKYLKIHTSLVSQVLNRKSDLSLDQAFLTAEYYKLEGPEREQFIDLVLMERAANPSAKKYFLSKIQQRAKAQEDLSDRLNAKTHSFSNENSIKFYSTTILQVAYALMHIPKNQKLSSLAAALATDELTAQQIVNELNDLNLLQIDGAVCVPRINKIHLSKGSQWSHLHHSSWRNRAIRMFEEKRHNRGVHYSGAITVSQEDSHEVKRILLQTIESIAGIVGPSRPEGAHALLVDFFPLSYDE